ncbi:ABC transporter substrate-binding protein [Comamonadaceae bacterium PP-2]
MNSSRRAFNAALLASGFVPLVSFPNRSLAATPVAGGTLRVAWSSEPTDFVPLNTSSGSTQFVGAKLFDGLLSYDAQLRPLPNLAESWKLAADGLSLSFTLRKDVKFSDGTPLTSADVAFSILRLKEVHPRGQTTFAAVTAVETPDARTAVIRLSRPVPYLILALTAAESPIVPKHIYETLKKGERVPADKIVSSGPFRIAEWRVGSHILLQRNPDYWNAGQPRLDRIVIRFISDPAARVAAFEAGDIDLLPEDLVPISDIARVSAQPGVRIDPGPYAYYGSIQQGLSFNLEREVLKDVRVRRAIAHALNVDEIIRKIYHGQAVASPTAITVYNQAFFDASLKPYAYDPALANRLLDEAGLPRGADGTRFKIKLTWNTEGAIPPTTPILYRQALAAVGIGAEIQTSDFAAFTKRIYTDRDWDLAIDRYGSTFDPTVGTQRFYHSRSFKVGVPFTNPARYENPEADALWDAAAIEVNPQKRREIFSKLQAVLLRDIPILPQVVATRNITSRTSVQGNAPFATGSFDSFAQAWLAA